MLRERVKAGMNQARRVGKHIGRPARRRLGRAEIERIRLLRSQGNSVRQLAKEFGASQWMDRQIGTRLMTGIQRLLDEGPVNECYGDLSTVIECTEHRTRCKPLPFFLATLVSCRSGHR
jgi:hypothetical protein